MCDNILFNIVEIYRMFISFSDLFIFVLLLLYPHKKGEIMLGSDM